MSITCAISVGLCYVDLIIFLHTCLVCSIRSVCVKSAYDVSMYDICTKHACGKNTWRQRAAMFCAQTATFPFSGKQSVSLLPQCMYCLRSPTQCTQSDAIGPCCVELSLFSLLDSYCMLHEEIKYIVHSAIESSW